MVLYHFGNVLYNGSDKKHVTFLVQVLLFVSTFSATRLCKSILAWSFAKIPGYFITTAVLTIDEFNEYTRVGALVTQPLPPSINKI